MPDEAFVVDTPFTECLERNEDRRFEPVDGELEGTAVRPVKASSRKG